MGDPTALQRQLATSLDAVVAQTDPVALRAALLQMRTTCDQWMALIDQQDKDTHHNESPSLPAALSNNDLSRPPSQRVALRKPGGKAHRQLATWGVTICKDTAKGIEFFQGLTEQVPISQVAAKDRCRICWPPSTW